MDAFEQIVSEILWQEGYWVRTSVKIELTKEEKRTIGRKSSPRWELDIVGYCARDNVLQVVECKSYLDSNGVHASAFDGSSPKQAARYKLFNEDVLRSVVFERLRQQFTAIGACRESPTVRLALACGKIRNARDRDYIKAHFARNGWTLWDETWLRERLERMAAQGYENQISAVVAKLLLR
ncbi:MAG: hypothetical protein ABF876_05355 [Acetobacter aceti]